MNGVLLQDSNRIPLHKWAIDPLYSSFIPLFVKCLRQDVVIISTEDIHELYLFKRPIRRVALYGIVVEKVTRSKHNARKVVLKIDDGTGVVECIKYISDSEVASPVDNITIGEFVHVKGVLIVVDSTLVVQAAIVEKSKDPNSESMHMMKVLRMYKIEYKKPVNVTANTFGTTQCCGNNLFVCKCFRDPSDVFDTVRNTLLYCGCVSTFSRLDQTTLLRMDILRYILRIHAAHKSTSANIDEASSVVLRVADFLIDPWLLQRVQRAIEREGDCDNIHYSSQSRYLPLGTQAPRETSHTPTTATSVHSDDSSSSCGRGLTSLKRDSESAALNDTKDKLLYHKKLRAPDSWCLSISSSASASASVLQERSRERYVLLQLIIHMCWEGIFLVISPLVPFAPHSSQNRHGVSAVGMNQDLSMGPPGNNCDDRSWDWNECGNFKVELATLNDVLLPFVRDKKKELLRETREGVMSQDMLQTFVVSSASKIKKLEKIPRWKWKLCSKKIYFTDDT